MARADDLIAGRYRLTQQLAAGRMAEVWAADDLELGRHVAIKFLATGADAVRFEREARTSAALSHPNLVQIYDYGEEDGRPYLALEYLPGGTLEEKLAAGAPLADAESAKIARELASGLAHAHARGVVHRDLNPANVLFDEHGTAKVADFGVAHLDSASTLSAPGTLLGTAAYLPPEQAAGAQATPGSDVYSFGLVLYRMLTGRLPFEAEDPLELARMQQERAPRPLAELRADAPPELASLAMAALARDPLERPQGGAALLAMLAPEETAPVPGATTQVTRVVAPPRLPRRRRGLVLVGLATVGGLLAAGFALAFLITRTNSNQPLKAGTRPGSTRARNPRVVGTSTAARLAGTSPSSAATTRPAATTSRKGPSSTAQISTSPTATAPPPPTAAPTAPPTTAATETATTTDTTAPPTISTAPTTSTGP